MTDINDIKRELEALTAKVAAYESEKATKRNWPERIEAGDCFEDAEEGKKWLCCGGQTCVCVIGPDLGVHVFGFREEWGYLGRDILTIRTDAHEPTGVELVGRRVNCFDMLDQLQFEGVCDEYYPDATCPYRIGRVWYFKARLAK